MLKAKEIREMSDEEIEKKLEELRGELLKERAKVSTLGMVENPGRVRAIKRAIARLLTIKREREIAANK